MKTVSEHLWPKNKGDKLISYSLQTINWAYKKIFDQRNTVNLQMLVLYALNGNAMLEFSYKVYSILPEIRLLCAFGDLPCQQRG